MSAFGGSRWWWWCVLAVLYTLLLATLFLLVPFAYFYYEECDLDTPRMKRVLDAVKPTGFLVLVVVVLLVIGLFVDTGQSAASEADASWFGALKASLTRTESVAGFLVACIVLVGFCVYLAYTAYGLSALPVALVRGHAQQPHAQPPHAPQQLQRRCCRTHTRTRALKAVLGAALFVAAGAVAASLSATLLDTALHSDCGYRCGYLLARPHYTGPLDALLVRLAPLHPLDALAVGALALVLLAGTLQGLAALGVRILWIELFRLRAHRMPPQGLVLAALYLALALLATLQQLTLAAPRYMAFGAQTHANATGAVLACSVDAPRTACHMSHTARMTLVATGTNQSFVGVILYYATWLFLIAWAGGLVFVLFRRTPLRTSADDDDDDDEPDDAVLDGSVPAAHHSKQQQHSRRKRHRPVRLRDLAVHSPSPPVPAAVPESSQQPEDETTGDSGTSVLTTA